MKTLRRIRIAIFASLFLAVGMAFWIAPIPTAEQFGLEAIRQQGLVSVRADLGGLFIGLGALVAFGAITRRRGALLAAATMIASVATGRLIGWVAGAGAPLAGRELALELSAMAGLLMLARRPRDASRPETRATAG